MCCSTGYLRSIVGSQLPEKQAAISAQAQQLLPQAHQLQNGLGVGTVGADPVFGPHTHYHVLLQNASTQQSQLAAVHWTGMPQIVYVMLAEHDNAGVLQEQALRLSHPIGSRSYWLARVLSSSQYCVPSLQLTSNLHDATC